MFKKKIEEPQPQLVSQIKREELTQRSPKGPPMKVNEKVSTSVSGFVGGYANKKKYAFSIPGVYGRKASEEPDNNK
jgi:hypothetical protein